MKGHKLLYGSSLLMVLGCAVNLLIDYQKYQTGFNSAPFWLWIVTDAVIWLIPAALAAAAGYVAKKKLMKKENSK